MEGHCVRKSFVSITSRKCTSFCDFGFISQFRSLVYVNGFAKYIITQAGTMAQWIEMLPSKPDNQNSTSRVHMVVGESQFFQVALWPADERGYQHGCSWAHIT